jgi:3-methyladenine DNA glycosylase Tag
VLGFEPAGIVEPVGGELLAALSAGTTRAGRNSMTPDTSGSQAHHHEVARPDPSDTRAYLEQLTKSVFIAGLNWKVVENKWPGLLEAFHGFDPEYVANLSPTQIETIAKDPAVIRNRSKIEATVENANVMLDLVKENGTFRDFLTSHPDPEATVQELKERFHHLGESSAGAFLWRVGEPTPEWRH